jgi:ankyrin repeat protein
MTAVSRDIYHAIMDGDVARFERLARSGGPGDVTETEHWNYLHRALLGVSEWAPAHMIKRLIEWGVDVKGVDAYGNTPLHYTARVKNADATQIITLLVDAGAAINVLNRDGRSPLREAILMPPVNVEAVRTLLELGADMNQKKPGGRSVREMIELNAAAHPGLKALIAEFSARTGPG